VSAGCPPLPPARRLWAPEGARGPRGHREPQTGEGALLPLSEGCGEPRRDGTGWPPQPSEEETRARVLSAGGRLTVGRAWMS
ncbi:hypothetical protein DV515_00006303, partial [Chloebia gouldiae]